MGPLATSVLSIGSALIGAIAGALITNWYLGRSNRRIAQSDSIGRLLETCKELRSVATQWYEQIAKRIDPSQSPHQIVENLRELWRGRRFEQEIDTHLAILRAAPDDSEAKSACSQVIGASAIWREAAFQGKRDADAAPSVTAGVLYMALSTSAELGRFFKDATNGPEQRKRYLEAVQDKLRLAYRDFDVVLDDAITRLAALQSARNY
jgi:hypothetical protein